MASAKPIVGIIMGSQSDWPTMKPASEILKALGIAHESKIVSAHRTPDRMRDYAKVFNDNVRDSDCVGRLGGDEFGVLLSHADQAQAHKKADILAQKLRASPTLFNGQTIEVSFAYGAFELKSGDDAAVAMARADEAMYAHKRGSR